MQFVFPAWAEDAFFSRARKVPAPYNRNGFEVTRRFRNEKGVPLVEVTYTGQVFHHKEGWDLVAKAQWGEMGCQVTYMAPMEPLAVEQKCDHCGKARDRRTVYVARNVAGDLLHLGGACAKAYWGTNILRGTGLNAFFEEMAGWWEEASDEGTGSNFVSVRWYDLERALRLAIRIVKEHGFVPSASERSTRQQLVITYLAVVTGKNPHEVSTEMASVEEAQGVIEWAKNLPGDTAFEMNMKEIATNGWFFPHTVGIVAFMASKFSTTTTTSTEKKNEWVGVPGARHNSPMTLTVRKKMEFDSMYGPVTMRLLVDAEGRSYKTVGKVPDGLRHEGDTTTVTFFVKEHNVYKDVKQTVINRISPV
jgi:hypothetical protein